MGGQAPDHPSLEQAGQPSWETRRRLALARIIFAVPGLFLGVITLVGAYRMMGRPLGDGPFWLVLAPIALGFAGVVGYALWQLRRKEPAQGTLSPPPGPAGADGEAPAEESLPR